MYSHVQGSKACTQLALLVALLSPPQKGFSQTELVPNIDPTPSSVGALLKHKFRNVYGGELRIDSMFPVTTAVIVNLDSGYVFNGGMGSFGPGGSSVSGYGGNLVGDRLAMPKHLRMILYPAQSKYLGRKYPYFEGTPIVDVTVPVAERIPEETLDDLRQNGGGLRLKLRIHPDTLLVGWDIVRVRGHKTGNTDPSGMYIYVPSQYSSIGGDFREATIFNGRVVEKGWYIDPKTKQRIETNF